MTTPSIDIEATGIQDPALRSIIFKRLETMLETPSELGIYKTSEFMDGLEADLLAAAPHLQVAAGKEDRQSRLASSPSPPQAEDSDAESVDRSAGPFPGVERPASRAHLNLVVAVLQCLESGVEPNSVRRFVEEELTDAARDAKTDLQRALDEQRDDPAVPGVDGDPAALDEQGLRGGKTPQEWADYLGSVAYQLTSEGENEGWVSGLPPDAALRLKGAVDFYTAAYDPSPSHTEEMP